MILTLFTIFLILALAFLFLGYLYSGSVGTQAPFLSIAGYSIIFILGIVVLFNGLTFQIGENENYRYGNNYSSGNHLDIIEGPGPSGLPTTLNIFHKNTTKIYSTFDDEVVSGIDLNHVLGFLLAVIGIIGFVHTFASLNRIRLDNIDED